MNWYLTVLKKYTVFSGRARRKEFWMFTLFNMIIAFILGALDGALGFAVSPANIGILGGIYSLAVLIPSIAVMTRRLHDINKSGWWQLIIFVPFIGVIVLIVFACLEGHPGENRFGANPKGM